MYEWNTSRVMAEKPDFAKCNHPPVHPTPPQGHPQNNSIYKGATECKMALFSHRHPYPKQGYTQHQKIHSEHNTMPFLKQLHHKKEPGQTEITQSAQAYFFRFNMLQ